MHIRHEALFRWLVDRFPESRLYGPYHHGGRSYYQWMARGAALVEDVLPLLEAELHARARRPRRTSVRARCASATPAYRARTGATAGVRVAVATGDAAALPASRRWRPLRAAGRAAEQLLALLDAARDDPQAPTAIRDRRRSSTTTSPTRSSRWSSSRSAPPRDRRPRRGRRLAGPAAGDRAAACASDASSRATRGSARSSSGRSRACGLGNAEVVHARAEAWPDGLGRFDVVDRTRARAARRVAEYAAPLLRLGGALVAWRGRRDPTPSAAAAARADELGLELGRNRSRCSHIPGAGTVICT